MKQLMGNGSQIAEQVAFLEKHGIKVNANGEVKEQDWKRAVELIRENGLQASGLYFFS